MRYHNMARHSIMGIIFISGPGYLIAFSVWNSNGGH